MTEQILRREGENLLNEAGEVVARFEANNIIGDLGGATVKSVSWVGIGEGRKAVVPIDEKPTLILCINAVDNNGYTIRSNDICPLNEGINALYIAWYRATDRILSGSTINNIIYTNGNIEISGGQDENQHFNGEGVKCTMYYI